MYAHFLFTLDPTVENVKFAQSRILMGEVAAFLGKRNMPVW